MHEHERGIHFQTLDDEGYGTPPPSPPADGRSADAGNWSVSDGRLTWRAAQQVPIGDAAVEFWSRDRPRGRGVLVA
ncbi:hypothetical protein ACN27G_09835 [Plantactinospora sp. WMMB334]|uniref:hypothetical protein n=1 Tax=Plantactinospora sp. WMMB334 TaxID=3404119 RepID=UPI003B930B27